MVFCGSRSIRNSCQEIAGADEKGEETSRMHPDDHAAHLKWIIVKRLWEQMDKPIQDPNPPPFHRPCQIPALPQSDHPKGSVKAVFWG